MGTRTISLTGRPPIRISDDRWPVIASGGRLRDHNGQDLARAAKVFVRQEWPEGMPLSPSESRCIVYAVYQTLFQGEQDRRAGEIVEAGGDLIGAIYRVVEAIEADRWIAEECIQNLPAEAM